MVALRLCVLWLVALLSLGGGRASGSEAQDQRARSRYEEGRVAFEGERYSEAYTCFRDAYLLSRAPELLYNMASALGAAGRPHEAAEELRAYLRARPDDPDRRGLESRMRALDEAQRILDARELERHRPGLLAMPTTPQRWSRQRTTAVVVGAILGGIALGALGVGLGLGLRSSPPETKLGNWPVTP